jgi:phosphinothricin acetyltransferase
MNSKRSPIMIREAGKQDAGAIAEIYNHYVERTVITFEIERVTPDEIAARMEKNRKKGPYLVYEEEGKVLGYAYVSRYHERKAYENTLESTVYVKDGYGGKGIGSALYAALLERLDKRYRTIIAVIALPNPASVGLHEKFGFKQAGLLKEVGRKFDKWIDVGYWQKMLTK